MTQPTPWKVIRDHDGDTGPFIVDANNVLIDVRRHGNAKLIVEAVNKLAKEQEGRRR